MDFDHLDKRINILLVNLEGESQAKKSFCEVVLHCLEYCHVPQFAVRMFTADSRRLS